MDFKIDAFDWSGKGTAIVVNRWINLGSGMMSPVDLEWECHLLRTGFVRIHQYPLRPIRGPGPKGSIQAAFESQAGQSYVELTAENSVKLFSRRERKPKTIGADGFVWRWHSPGSSWWYLESSEKKSVLLS
jgi:hypothetical protein